MIFSPLFAVGAFATFANAYWLMGVEDFITTERIDPVVSPGKVSSHVHSVLGASNFRMNVTTAALRQSLCTSIPIPQDKSAYWFPHLYFHWANGNFTSLNGGAVIYYLFNDKAGTTTAFPDDFRMISGNPTLRTYNPNSFEQQAVSFLCLDFDGVSTKHAGIPTKACPSGIRAQINFPSCWDGKNTDSVDHKSHVAFPSGGPDSGTCSDPKFPVTLARIFMEVYWDSHSFDNVRNQAANSTQPFAFSYGDPTGYGYHADFINGWDRAVLQNALDRCHCDPYGDPTCCVNQGIFSMDKGKTCRITKAIDETTTGTITKLPGNNPVVVEGRVAPVLADNVTPGLISPIYAYTGDKPTASGKVVSAPTTAAAVGSAPSVAPATVSSNVAAAVSTPVAALSVSHVPASSPQAATATSIAAPAVSPTASAASKATARSLLKVIAGSAPDSADTTDPDSGAAVSPPSASAPSESSDCDPSRLTTLKKHHHALNHHSTHFTNL